jgi:predicted nucleic acid-binding protein
LRHGSGSTALRFLTLVSVLSLGELFYISFRIGDPDAEKALVNNIDLSCRVIPVDRKIIQKAASLKAGRAISYIDSIILATFMLADCKTIHTTYCNQFLQIKNKGFEFAFYYRDKLQILQPGHFM